MSSRDKFFRNKDDSSDDLSEEEIKEVLDDDEMDKLAEKLYKQSIEDKEEKARRIYSEFLKSERDDKEEEERLYMERLQKDENFTGFEPYFKEVILSKPKFEFPELDSSGLSINMTIEDFDSVDEYYNFFKDNFKSINVEDDNLTNILKKLFLDLDNKITKDYYPYNIYNSYFPQLSKGDIELTYDQDSGNLYLIKDLYIPDLSSKAIYVGKGKDIYTSKEYPWFIILQDITTNKYHDTVTFINYVKDLNDSEHIELLSSRLFRPPSDFLYDILVESVMKQVQRKNFIWKNFTSYGDDILYSSDGDKICISKALLAIHSPFFFNYFKYKNRGKDKGKDKGKEIKNTIDIPKLYINLYQQYLLTNDLPEETIEPIIFELIEFAAYLQDYRFLSWLVNVVNERFDVSQYEFEEFLSNIVNPYSKKGFTILFDLEEKLLQLYQEYEDELKNSYQKVYNILKPFDTLLVCSDNQNILVNKLYFSIHSPFFFEKLRKVKTVSVPFPKKYLEEYQKYIFGVNIDNKIIKYYKDDLIKFGFDIQDYHFVYFIFNKLYQTDLSKEEIKEAYDLILSLEKNL